MPAVKVLPKGQITLPKKTRERLGIKVGDTLILEEKGKGITLARGKTLLDFKGALPDLGMTIGEMREKAIALAVKRNG
jgi:AbrB family looped-hinge helix DNA binding protein